MEETKDLNKGRDKNKVHEMEDLINIVKMSVLSDVTHRVKQCLYTSQGFYNTVDINNHTLKCLVSL